MPVGSTQSIEWFLSHIPQLPPLKPHFLPTRCEAISTNQRPSMLGDSNPLLPHPVRLCPSSTCEAVSLSLCHLAHLRMDVSVLLQAHSMAEGFATDVTGKGPGSTMRAADMHFQPVRGGEHLRQSKESGPRKDASLRSSWPWA